MKKMKKLVAVVLASSLVCTTSALSTSAVAYSAETNVQTGIDSIDAIIASHYFLASQEDTQNFWSDDLTDVEIVPLYDTAGAISSYYVELTGGIGYAIINNNIDNPTAIEFGKGINPQIRKILDDTENPHIIYNSPVSIYNESETMTLSLEDDIPDIYDNYPDLHEPNSELASAIAQQKAIVESSNPIMPYGDGDYGFLDPGDLPVAPHRDSMLRNLSGTEWVRGGDIAGDGVKHHCGSTAVANLALYFINNGYTNLSKGDRIATFRAVHDVVGNGPKMTIADDAKEYFDNCGYTLNYKTDNSSLFANRLLAVKTAITYDRPCGLLLSDGLFSWHWILAVGYRIYPNSDEMYFQIVDGWYATSSRYYKPSSGSLWHSMTEYWIG